MLLRIAIAVLLSAVSLAQNNTLPAKDDVGRMDQIVQSYTPRRFMGTVLVARDGNVIFSKGYGSANLEWDIPNAPGTKFRLGSITKQFTAASILLLEERGKLKTDDLVKKYMPDAPAAWDKITIFHLLTHTSGIPSFTSFPDYHSLETAAITPEKLVEWFRDKPLDFQPGEKWSYSNSGYALLGYLIEKISGQTYSDFLQRNVFTPLGMKDSGYDSNSAIIPRRAAGYERNGDKVVNSDFINMTVPFAAGALYSTTEDLLRWERGLFGGKVLTAASLAKMTTPFKNNYAFGLAVSATRGHKTIEHGGGIEGFQTQMTYYPEDKLEVVVLSNLAAGAPPEIASRLAEAAHGETVVLPSERKEITVAPAILAAYAGTYEITPTFSIVVTLEDGHLMTQATGQRKIEIFPESETRFFLKVVDAQLEFVKNEKGEVTHLILRQGGRETKGIRK